MSASPRGSATGCCAITGIGEIIVFRCWDGDGLAPFEIDADSLREFTEISAIAAAGGWPMHVHAILDEQRRRDPRRVGGGRPRRTRSAACASASRTPRASASARSARARALGLGLALQDRMLMRASGSVPRLGRARRSSRRRRCGGCSSSAFRSAPAPTRPSSARSTPGCRCGGSSADGTFGGPRRAAEHRLIARAGARASTRAAAPGSPPRSTSAARSRPARSRTSPCSSDGLLRRRRGRDPGAALGADDRRRARRACRRGLRGRVGLGSTLRMHRSRHRAPAAARRRPPAPPTSSSIPLAQARPTRR